LVTRAALLSGDTLSGWATSHVLSVLMIVIALSRKISVGVTIETPRMSKHRHDRLECCLRARVVALNDGGSCH